MSAQPTQEMLDERLEHDIEAAFDRMIKGDTEEASRSAWTEMAVLIRRRSPTQIMKLELERRLVRREKQR